MEARVDLGAELSTGVLAVTYLYRCAKRFEVGVAFSYTGYFREMYALSNWSVVGRLREHYVTVMPFIRIPWLYRKGVRMYFGGGLGYQWASLKDYNGKRRYASFTVGQFTLLGVAIGGRVTGYLEFGCGAMGLLCGGVGYRFNAERKK